MSLDCLINEKQKKVRMNDDLLKRYIQGEVTTEEAETVVDWLDEDESHVKEFMALHKVHDITVLNPMPQSAKEKVSRSVSLRRIMIEVVKIAAVVLLVFGSQLIWDKRGGEDETTPLYQTIYVPAGQRAELLLPDSTKVWLNAHSKLVYPIAFLKDSRSVELDGEAYFEVKRNEAAPFIVKTSKARIRVLGTEFNVIDYREEKDFEVSLLKGRVELGADGQSGSYLMKPGERVVGEAGKFVSSNIQDPDYFKWREGMICFNELPISEIMERLSLYFDVEIDLRNRQLADEHYTGKFRTKDGVEQVLRVLQLEHRFTYKRDNENNVIIIK